MKSTFKLIIAAFVLSFLVSCGPKSVESDTGGLSLASKSWIPYTGTEEITFELDTNTLVFKGTGKVTYYENVRYKSDQSGFFTTQTDYYADLERQRLVMESTSTRYYLSFVLSENLAETGKWDMLQVTIADGDYYSNDMSFTVFKTNNDNKGERFKFKKKLTLNGTEYSNVYYWIQERRPFEIYYTKAQGVIAFKLGSHELWTLKTD